MANLPLLKTNSHLQQLVAQNQLEDTLINSTCTSSAIEGITMSSEKFQELRKSKYTETYLKKLHQNMLQYTTNL